MKASELIKRLEELVDKHGDLDLIYSSDDEGNYYNKVLYQASECMFINGMREEPEDKPTHICIN